VESRDSNKNSDSQKAPSGVWGRILVTAALPYANGPIHIGHMAGVYIPADIYVRYQRAKKTDIKFVCGSDEHGVPITIRALKEGVSPQQIVDKYAIIKKVLAGELRLIFIQEQLIQFIIRPRQIFLKNCMTMVCLRKRKQSNTMMKKQKHF
jgi:hypothetical protein